ncbi:MAG: alpha/beta fold hydrolase [Polyangiales bacterium]
MRSGDAEIAYFVEGEGDSTLLLIMGLGASSADWGSTFPALLAERHRVVALDNRGTGTSSRVPGPFSLEELARDAIAVLDDVGAEKAHVLGLSMGGMIAQLIALDHRERVEKLVLMSTHCGGANAAMPLPHVLPHLMPAPGTPADVIVRTRLAAIAGPGWAEKNGDEIELRVKNALAAPVPQRTYRAQLEAIMKGDRHARLEEISAPTLVVHGDVDPLVPYPNGELLAARIPGARLVTLRGVGHLPMWEAPEETARSVLDFLV